MKEFPESLVSVATKLVEYCQTGQEQKGLDEYYHPDCISVEALDMDGMCREIKGVEGIKQKHAWWQNNMEEHSSSVDGPYLHGDDQFSVIFEVDVTQKETGERSQIREPALYTVSKGKIVKEQFFYALGGCSS